MDVLSLFMFIGVLLGVVAFFRSSKQSDRIQALERKMDGLLSQLSELKNKTVKSTVTSAEIISIADVSMTDVSSTEVVSEPFEEEWQPKPPPPPPPKRQPKSNVQPAIPTSLENSFSWLKENWPGFIGVSILVLGITFGTVYLSFFASPFLRFLMLIGIGLSFFVAGFFLRQKAMWHELSGWLQSASGAIILFATVATGYFEALHFYHNPIIGLYLLFAGLLYNLILAYFAAKETLACLHVVISLLALMVVPKELIVFAAAVVVTLGGIVLSVRQAWNINLFISFFTFAIFHYIWLQAQVSVASIALYSVIGTCIVGACALLAHYQKTYQKIETDKNIFVHISIWLLFGAQLALYNLGFAYIYVPLTIATVASFGLSLYAKKQKMDALFVCDAIVGQVLAILAILSLKRIDFHQDFIAWIATLEALSFSTIAYCSRQMLLSKVGSAFTVVSFLALCYTLFQMYGQSAQILYIGIPTLMPLYAVRWYLATKGMPDKNALMDSFEAFFPCLLDMMYFMLGIVLLFLSIGEYRFGYIGVLAVLLAMAFNKSLIQQAFHQGIYLVFVMLMVGYSWFKAAFIPNLTQACLLYALPPTVLMFSLLKEKIFQLQSKINIEDIWVYLLGMHLGVLSTILLWSYSTFLPGISFLILGLLFFESSYLIEKAKSSRRFFISVACKNMAIVYLLGYCGLYILLYLQSEASVSIFSITQLLTLSALVLSFYWYFSKPLFIASPPEFSCRWSVQASEVLGAITFDIGVILTLFLLISTFSAPIHPIGYAIIACIFSVPIIREFLPLRALVYSICLIFATCIQVAIVSSKWASPLSDWYQNTHITGPISLLLAFVAASFLLKQPQTSNENKILEIYYKTPVLIGSLPVFTALALFLFWRFDKAYLTMLWVVEILAMVMVGYLLKSKKLVHIAFAFLAFCVARLITYDLAQTDLLVRALVFVVVGLLMIFIHIIYKKFAGRLS